MLFLSRDPAHGAVPQQLRRSVSILATIMAWPAPFLEANFCNPRRDALEAMFLPLVRVAARKADEADQGVDPETKLQYYRRFTRAAGAGYKIEESSGKALWFVAPQAGDRLRMTRESGLRRMAGAAGKHADLIRSYLICDNVMAYLQCALFGTIRCMLPRFVPQAGPSRLRCSDGEALRVSRVATVLARCPVAPEERAVLVQLEGLIKGVLALFRSVVGDRINSVVDVSEHRYPTNFTLQWTTATSCTGSSCRA
ncbi:hypothetical protein Q5P01_000597 [Channa striata]|uniref:Uncharacterized protein n=1 Tax=Channa striata TaxID=64152 RepID=A0AA88LE43_CHASR|nr:hypothetical protein Q5P01_000597 [Channa striata]